MINLDLAEALVLAPLMARLVASAMDVLIGIIAGGLMLIAGGVAAAVVMFLLTERKQNFDSG